MARILIIAETWPDASGDGPRLRNAFEGAGYETAVITREESRPVRDDGGLIRIPFEAPRGGGALFAARNALFFGTAANPGNYAMLRDTLHMHLQETLYDAVVILCPPVIYLRLCFWIDESFGIPVWLHLSSRLDAAPGGALANWNHRRLRQKYLTRARVLSAGSADLLNGLPRADLQLVVLKSPDDGGIQFRDPGGDVLLEARAVLDRVIRRKPLP